MLRYESGQFPVNQEISAAYLEAAAATGRMDQVNVSVRVRGWGRGEDGAPGTVPSGAIEGRVRVKRFSRLSRR